MRKIREIAFDLYHTFLEHFILVVQFALLLCVIMYGHYRAISYSASNERSINYLKRHTRENLLTIKTLKQNLKSLEVAVENLRMHKIKQAQMINTLQQGLESIAGSVAQIRSTHENFASAKTVSDAIGVIHTNMGNIDKIHKLVNNAILKATRTRVHYSGLFTLLMHSLLETIKRKPSRAKDILSDFVWQLKCLSGQPSPVYCH